MQAPERTRMETTADEATNPRRQENEKTKDMKAKLVELLFRNSDGTHPVLVIPHGRKPYIERRG